MSLRSSSVERDRSLQLGSLDDDTSSFRSARGAQDTDSEDEKVLKAARTSAEVRQYDRSVLEEEEELNRLLQQNKRRSRSRTGSIKAGIGKGLKRLFTRSYAELPGVEVELLEKAPTRREKKRDKRKQRAERRKSRKARLVDNASRGEDGELLYEMEEGAMKEGSTTGESSDTEEASIEFDRRGLRGLQEDKKQRTKQQRAWCLLYLLITAGFMVLVTVAWKLSVKVRQYKADQKMLSNGTALFAPTTILISLDGFRADFLQRGITPNMNAFVAEGVSPDYMMPSFPSVTFPNHYTLATGLYPESHGIVGNSFWDVDLQEEFFYTHPEAMNKKWWGGEPLWVTAENQGIRSAIHMWPGSEARIMDVEPSFIDKYNGGELLPNKVKRILELLDMPGKEAGGVEASAMRPQLIAAYVPNVDSDGHLYGPNSTEIRVTINDVDTMLGHLFSGLKERNLTDIVNVVIVSDHGMASTDTSRMIQLEDLIDTDLIAHTDGWPLYGLRPKDPNDLQGLYDKLSAHAKMHSNIEVYLRDVNMPERYHFSKNKRIAPLWIVPKTGWAITTRHEFDIEEAKKKGTVYHPRGLHGYDHEHPLMRAIFLARGPAFPHMAGSRIEPFQNIEVYNIVCDSLALTPRPNNGTLRLPLKPIGVHSSSTTLPIPSDPHSSSLPSQPHPSSTASHPEDPSSSFIEVSPIEASSAADPNVKPPAMVGVDRPDANVGRPVVEDESRTGKGKGEKWWDWAKETLGEFTGWIEGLVGVSNIEGKKGGDADGK